MKLALYCYDADTGCGSLSGMFIAPIGLPEKMVEEGRQVYWGEVLGKHSEVIDHFDKWSFSKHDVSDQLISLMVEELGLVALYNWAGVYSVSGYNPFEKLDLEDE